MGVALSQDLRRRIVAAVEDGSSIRKAAARYSVSISAVLKLIRRVRKSAAAHALKQRSHPTNPFHSECAVFSTRAAQPRVSPRGTPSALHPGGGAPSKEEAPDCEDDHGSDYRPEESSPSIRIVPTRLLSKRGSDESPGNSEKDCYQEARGLLPSWGDQPCEQTREKPEEGSPEEIQMRSPTQEKPSSWSVAGCPHLSCGGQGR
jgi:Transposase